MTGQTNISLITLPAESDLPNVVGLPFASRYATYIRNDQPQIFQLNGQTVRTPQIEFLPLGSGGQGITRRAPICARTQRRFRSARRSYVFNFDNIFDIDDPLRESVVLPRCCRQPGGAVSERQRAQNDGQTLGNSQFLFDTGADVTVVSEFNAVQLGFDPVLDEPDFTVAVVGSGGTIFDVPGFFVDQFTIHAVGGSHHAHTTCR